MSIPVTLSWDLFVIVFFAMVVTYSFIIGKDESVKIIVASYISIVAVQGIGNLLGKIPPQVQPYLDMIGVSMSTSVLATTKLITFIVAIVFLAVRGGIDIQYKKNAGELLNLIATGLFGFSTAGLLLSTLLTYIAGTPLLDIDIAKAETVMPILAQSELMRMLVTYQDVWFCLPGIALIIVGAFSDDTD